MRGKPRSGRERREITSKREPFEVVLIVCEGLKTEPEYFSSICRDLRLSSANVVVLEKESGSSPTTVVDYALRRFKNSKSFDRVFCVFDRDAHADYQTAVDRCGSLRQTNVHSCICPFVAITSTPSFEYWIYLHFKDSDAPVVAAGGKSSGDLMLSNLRREFAEYSKSRSDLFEVIKSSTALAAKRARRVNSSGVDNPHTRVVDLVHHLASFRKDCGIAWVDELLSAG